MKSKKFLFYFWGSLIFTALFLVAAPLGNTKYQKNESLSVDALLSQLQGWKLTEQPLEFQPENLFEYINGAAEIYIAYDFRTLTVLQFGQEGQPVNLSVEIYEMSTPTNAFGIYSAERFPDNQFIPVGAQGYIEEGSLNCLIGKRYVKLICFEGGERCQDYLKQAAGSIDSLSPGEKGFPPVLQNFPREGLIVNSEKFILKNVMGYGFLHHGFLASYSVEGLDFDCFIIQGRNEDDARDMLARYLEAKKEQPIQEFSGGVLIKDRYYKNIYVSRTGTTVFGVMKIAEGKEDIGKTYFSLLQNALSD